MRDRFWSACGACMLAAATLVSTSHAEDSDPQGKLAYWDIDYYALNGTCHLETHAYEPGGGLTGLRFESSARGTPELIRSILHPHPGVLRIETAGSSNSWDIPLDAEYPGMSAADIDLLLTDIGKGNRLVLTASPADGPVIRYVAPLRGAVTAVAMFRACVQASSNFAAGESARPDEFFRVMQSDEVCLLGRTYGIGRTVLSVNLIEAPDGASIAVSPGVLWVGRRLLADNNSDRPTLAPSMHMTNKPFVAELEDLFAARIESTAPASASAPLDGEQMSTLERELMGAGHRNIALSVKGEHRLQTTFGGPLAAVPAAMFSACRKAKFS